MYDNISASVISTSLANNVAFIVSNYLLLFLGFVSASMNVLLLVVLGRAKHFDHSVTILLFNMSFAAAVLSAYRFLKAIADIIRIACALRLVINVMTCKLIEAVYLSSGLVVIWSALAMAVDRLIATKKPNSYTDEWSRYIPCLIGLEWIAATIMALITAIVIGDRDMDVPHCNVIIVAPLTLVTVLCIVTVVIELTLAGMFIFVWFYSRHYLKQFGNNAAATSLRGRFQTYRNMRAARIMLPSVSVHCGIWLICATVVSVARQSEMTPTDLFVVGQYGSDGLVLLHALLHPLICFLFNPELMSELKSLVYGSQSFPNEGTGKFLREPVQTTHFELLTKAWANK